MLQLGSYYNHTALQKTVSNKFVTCVRTACPRVKRYSNDKNLVLPSRRCINVYQQMKPWGDNPGAAMDQHPIQGEQKYSQSLYGAEARISFGLMGHLTCMQTLFCALQHVKLVVGNEELKELRHRSCILKKLAKLFKIVISNPFQSSPSSAILVPFRFRITTLVFSFISKSLVLGFPRLKPWLMPSKNDLKYREVAPLNLKGIFVLFWGNLFFCTPLQFFQEYNY